MGVLVDLEEDIAGKVGVDACKFVKGEDHDSALEVGDWDLSFKVGLENFEDLGVSKVSNGTDVSLDLAAVTVGNGSLEVLFIVGKVLVSNSLGMLWEDTSINVDRVVVVGVSGVDIGFTAKLSESKESSFVELVLVLNIVGSDKVEERVHVFLVWETSGDWKTADHASGFGVGDLLVFNDLLDLQKGRSGTGFN